MMTDAQHRDARAAHLKYVSDAGVGYTRCKAGRGFTYRDAGGASLGDPAERARIKSLVIPPAWIDVWICMHANGHLQATGRDARGRKQYIYHVRFLHRREQTKYGRMLNFARHLPGLRARVSRDLARPGLPRAKVLAAMVRLLDRTSIRIGNAAYAEQNNSYGLTTLRPKHVCVTGADVHLTFLGKSKKAWSLTLRDARVASVISACRKQRRRSVFCYFDESNECRGVSSGDVNAYLRDACGGDVTAKDFRTWRGTVVAASALTRREGQRTRSAIAKQVSAAVRQTAEVLGNTPAVCRKSYVHPKIIEAFEADTPEPRSAPPRRGLGQDEARVLNILEEN